MKYEFKFDSMSDWKSVKHWCYDAQSAAENIAEEYWSDEHEPMDPSKFKSTVEIRDENKVVVKFNVTAEATVNFYAHKVEV